VNMMIVVLINLFIIENLGLIFLRPVFREEGEREAKKKEGTKGKGTKKREQNTLKKRIGEARQSLWSKIRRRKTLPRKQTHKTFQRRCKLLPTEIMYRHSYNYTPSLVQKNDLFTFLE